MTDPRLISAHAWGRRSVTDGPDQPPYDRYDLCAAWWQARRAEQARRAWMRVPVQFNKEMKHAV